MLMLNILLRFLSWTLTKYIGGSTAECCGNKVRGEFGEDATAHFKRMKKLTRPSFDSIHISRSPDRYFQQDFDYQQLQDKNHDLTHSRFMRLFVFSARGGKTQAILLSYVE